MPVISVGKGRGVRHAYDLASITDYIRAAGADLVVVEAVTRPGSLRENKAFILGVAYALDIETLTVPSPVWKRHFGAGAPKEESRAAAQSIWPEYGFDRMKKGADGLWEACLIGRFAYEALPS